MSARDPQSQTDAEFVRQELDKMQRGRGVVTPAVQRRVYIRALGNQLPVSSVGNTQDPFSGLPVEVRVDITRSADDGSSSELKGQVAGGAMRAPLSNTEPKPESSLRRAPAPAPTSVRGWRVSSRGTGASYQGPYEMADMYLRFGVLAEAGATGNPIQFIKVDDTPEAEAGSVMERVVAAYKTALEAEKLGEFVNVKATTTALEHDPGAGPDDFAYKAKIGEKIESLAEFCQAGPPGGFVHEASFSSPVGVAERIIAMQLAVNNSSTSYDQAAQARQQAAMIERVLARRFETAGPLDRGNFKQQTKDFFKEVNAQIKQQSPESAPLRVLDVDRYVRRANNMQTQYKALVDRCRMRRLMTGDMAASLESARDAALKEAAEMIQHFNAGSTDPVLNAKEMTANDSLAIAAKAMAKEVGDHWADSSRSGVLEAKNQDLTDALEAAVRDERDDEGAFKFTDKTDVDTEVAARLKAQQAAAQERYNELMESAERLNESAMLMRNERNPVVADAIMDEAAREHESLFALLGRRTGVVDDLRAAELINMERVAMLRQACHVIDESADRKGIAAALKDMPDLVAPLLQAIENQDDTKKKEILAQVKAVLGDEAHTALENAVLYQQTVVQPLTGFTSLANELAKKDADGNPQWDNAHGAAVIEKITTLSDEIESLKARAFALSAEEDMHNSTTAQRRTLADTTKQLTEKLAELKLYLAREKEGLIADKTRNKGTMSREERVGLMDVIDQVRKESGEEKAQELQDTLEQLNRDVQHMDAVINMDPEDPKMAAQAEAKGDKYNIPHTKTDPLDIDALFKGVDLDAQWSPNYNKPLGQYGDMFASIGIFRDDKGNAITNLTNRDFLNALKEHPDLASRWRVASTDDKVKQVSFFLMYGLCNRAEGSLIMAIGRAWLYLNQSMPMKQALPPGEKTSWFLPANLAQKRMNSEIIHGGRDGSHGSLMAKFQDTLSKKSQEKREKLEGTHESAAEASKDAASVAAAHQGGDESTPAPTGAEAGPANGAGGGAGGGLPPTMGGM